MSLWQPGCTDERNTRCSSSETQLNLGFLTERPSNFIHNFTYTAAIPNRGTQLSLQVRLYGRPEVGNLGEGEPGDDLDARGDPGELASRKVGRRGWQRSGCAAY